MVTIQGNRYMSDFEAKKAMTEIGRRMDQKGYAIAGDGSLSVRTGPGAVWITVAGADKGNLTQDMFVKVGLDGKQAMSARSKELPTELSWHLKIYQDRPDVKAVIQAYPPMSNARAICGQGMKEAFYTDAVRKLGEVPVVAEPSQLGASALGRHGILASKVGCLTWGDTMLEAYHHMEAMEYHAVMDKCLGEQGTAPCACPPPVCEPVAAPMPEQIPALKGVTPLVKPEAAVARPMPSYQPVQPASASSEPTAPMRVVDVPREQVMAEVVRRVTANF